MVTFLTWLRSLGKLMHNVFDICVNGALVAWQCFTWLTRAAGHALELCGNVSIKLGKAMQSFR